MWLIKLIVKKNKNNDTNSNKSNKSYKNNKSNINNNKNKFINDSKSKNQNSREINDISGTQQEEHTPQPPGCRIVAKSSRIGTTGGTQRLQHEHKKESTGNNLQAAE